MWLPLSNVSGILVSPQGIKIYKFVLFRYPLGFHWVSVGFLWIPKSTVGCDTNESQGVSRVIILYYRYYVILIRVPWGICGVPLGILGVSLGY